MNGDYENPSAIIVPAYLQKPFRRDRSISDVIPLFSQDVDR